MIYPATFIVPFGFTMMTLRIERFSPSMLSIFQFARHGYLPFLCYNSGAKVRRSFDICKREQKKSADEHFLVLLVAPVTGSHADLAGKNTGEDRRR